MRNRVGQAVLGAVLLAAFLLLISCMKPASEPSSARGGAKMEPPAEGAAPKQHEGNETAQNPYAEPLTPLSVRQCGQCHPGIYNALRESGGGHRFPCQECHQRFHVADPQEAAPDCATCHEGPHEPGFNDCLACHREPHAPLQIPLSESITSNCAECHRQPAGELQQSPSAHTALACSDCHHHRHGYVPDCGECHQPHFPDQPGCGECHPVHRPLQTEFGAHPDPLTCAACHAAVYEKWQTSPSRHAQVNCAGCHDRHGRIPRCSECHPQPHSEKILAAYPDCLTCHLDAHSPPVKREP